MFILAIIPAEAHTILLSSIASHGVVVVAVWKLGSPEDSFNPEWFEATVDFVENRLENSLHNQEGKITLITIIELFISLFFKTSIQCKRLCFGFSR